MIDRQTSRVLLRKTVVEKKKPMWNFSKNIGNFLCNFIKKTWQKSSLICRKCSKSRVGLISRATNLIFLTLFIVAGCNGVDNYHLYTYINPSFSLSLSIAVSISVSLSVYKICLLKISSRSMVMYRIEIEIAVVVSFNSKR